MENSARLAGWAQRNYLEEGRYTNQVDVGHILKERVTVAL